MQAFAPAERDLALQETFTPLGLLDDDSPYVDAEPVLAEMVRAGVARGTEAIEQALHHTGDLQNGWNLTYHAFDYNLDFFEIGALDESQWKLDLVPKLRYFARAAAARGGLWGNHGYEAAYAMVYLDGDGNLLDGTKSYRLRFEETPPVGAFWSVTMYDSKDFYLLDNPIDRYSIGDRTPGVRRAADGSLTIVLQHDEPETEEDRANWLPTPAAPFRPILRMYEPQGAAFDGGYVLPPIVSSS
ncbi:MAG TPA: DUF1214 domain-containing protein [Gaiellaceae bacterium]|jgi:hypothetical protein|nr:DUF1214 domain-containing protein [Gaiellaceae bacterium]